MLERSQKFNEHEYQSIPRTYLNETLIGHDFALHFINSFWYHRVTWLFLQQTCILAVSIFYDFYLKC